jgi:hypothetical protein
VETIAVLAAVRTQETRNGNVRYVARDQDGNEYTTFREDIGQRAAALEHTRVRIEYHENRRGQYTNVYLDKIEPAEPDRSAPAGQDGEGSRTDAQEAAWRTAVEAAPWLVGKPQGAVPPDELYDKLKPFEDRVKTDIEKAAGHEADGGRH